ATPVDGGDVVAAVGAADAGVTTSVRSPKALKLLRARPRPKAKAKAKATRKTATRPVMAATFLATAAGGAGAAAAAASACVRTAQRATSTAGRAGAPLAATPTRGRRRVHRAASRARPT